MPSDQLLIDHVKRAIATGATKVEIPAELLTNASKEALDETRRYCKLCGVKMVMLD